MGTEKPSTHVGLTDGLGKAALVDLVSGALVAIDHAHAHVHEQEAFNVSAVDVSLSDGETVIIAFKTPDTRRMHLVVSFSVAVAGHIEIIEAPTWTTDTGTVVAPSNRFLSSDSPTSEVSEDKTASPDFTAGGVLENPTGLDGGDVIGTEYLMAGPGGKEGGGTQGRGEWVLAQNTRYAVKLTADGNANGGQLVLDWYEHADSNA